MTAAKKQVNDNTNALTVTTAAAPPAPVSLGILQGTSPAALMSGASEMAGELAKMIEAQRLWDPINGKKYVKVEGWTTLGVMMGVVAREVATTENDGIYTAVVELVRMLDGACISRASAECGAPDELDRYGKPVWSNRPRYARRSMAQTRATGKACRLAFSWVMSLAGYEVTPAEEMTHVHDPVVPNYPQQIRPPVNDNTRPSVADSRINPSQRIMLETRITESGLNRERVKAWIERSWKVDSFICLSNDQLNKLLIKIGQWSAAEKSLAEAKAVQEVGNETV
ncbi:hypothetical protein RCF98_17585 (plasmid) [Thiothrix lacustris]|uniref:Recombinase n=1 Tax=Thiothrix lacustris TaxID=525917 RepID=A0ABY9MVF2_9GAMM|nr:hypothetical protein [Thiothrix lacustris]WML92497.1 hypothetical protein RCF98_17585 [Thiothrix lacustris]